jgi:hypothetical protein
MPTTKLSRSALTLDDTKALSTISTGKQQTMPHQPYLYDYYVVVVVDVRYVCMHMHMHYVSL